MRNTSLLIVLTIFPTAAFAIAELGDARERLIESALERVKDRTRKGAGENERIGSKWWVVHRRPSDIGLKIMMENVKSFQIAKEDSGLYYLEQPRGGAITKEGFEKLVQQKSSCLMTPPQRSMQRFAPKRRCSEKKS